MEFSIYVPATDMDRSSSPFWRGRTASGHRDASPKKQSSESGPGIVVGAGYSHADILKFDNLHVLRYLGLKE